jgi:hypothetical protein
MNEYPQKSIACGYCFRQLPIVIIEEKTVRDGRALKIQTPVVYPAHLVCKMQRMKPIGRWRIEDDP